MNYRKIAAKQNGKLGGRPRQDSKIQIELPGIKLVVLTPTQYGSLLEKYGYKLVRQALFILDRWLKTGGSKNAGKNSYAYFRADGWLLNEAARAVSNED